MPLHSVAQKTSEARARARRVCASPLTLPPPAIAMHHKCTPRHFSSLHILARSTGQRALLQSPHQLRTERRFRHHGALRHVLALSLPATRNFAAGLPPSLASCD